jgi:lipid A 3-O-deacylase
MVTPLKLLGRKPLSKCRLSSVLAAAALALCAGLTNGPAKADSYDPALLVLGAGAYDVLHQDKDALFRGEYRFGTRILYVRPIVGVEVNTGGGVYAYGGFGINLPITDHIVLFPSGAFGYWERGDSKNLGAHEEFRTGAEIAYRFDDASRIGVSFHHISNAGITQRNPGVEEAMVEYAIPLGSLLP